MNVKLQQMVVELGWDKTCELVGLSDKLTEFAFDNNPTNFLQLFGNLTVVRSDENDKWLFFKDHNNCNIIFFDDEIGCVYINDDIIWSTLQYKFNLTYNQTKEYITIWLLETYDLKGLIVVSDIFGCNQ